MERPLADGEARLGADPGQPGFELLDAVPMSLCELGRRGPLLSVMADVLALVLADRTAVGRCGRRGVLRAAGDADERGHGGKCACGSQRRPRTTRGGSGTGESLFATRPRNNRGLALDTRAASSARSPADRLLLRPRARRISVSTRRRSWGSSRTR